MATDTLPLQVSREDFAPCEVRLTIEIGQEAVDRAYEKALRRVVNQVEVPGFRRGKAPVDLVRPLVSDERLTDFVKEDLIPRAYEQAVVAENISPFASPTLTVKQIERGNSLIMEALIPLPPRVTLGDITGLKLAHTIYEPTNEAIEKQLKAWHEERAEFEELPGKSAEIGDLIRVNVLLYEGSPPEDRQPETVFWEIGKNHPDLDAQLIGVAEGERKIIVITDPGRGDSNQGAIRTLTYSVEVLKVGRRKLPELSDAYLQGLGIEGGLPRLRKLIEEDMRRVLEGMADAELRSQAVRKAAELSTVLFPQAMIQREIYRNLLNVKKEAEKHRMGLRQYFQAAGKDIAEYERESAAAADERIRTGLLLGEIAEKYEIRVSEDELRSECVRLGERQKLPGDVVYERMKATGAIADIEDQLLYRRITDFLIEKAEVERTTKPLSEAAKEGEAEQAIG